MTASLVVALLAVQAVGPGGPDCRHDSAAVREVLAVASGIVDADNARDLERVLGYYAADAVLLPPGEVCAGDGLAFVRGRNRGRLVARAGGAARELDDVFVMLLRRGTGGAFRISHLIWHRASADERR
jgi:hypothetical protein